MHAKINIATKGYQSSVQGQYKTYVGKIYTDNI